MVERIERIKKELAGVVSILGGIYIALSLATHSIWDSSFFVFSTLPVKNYGGLVGSYLSDLLIFAIGLSAFSVPIILFVYGIRKLLGSEGHWIHAVGSALFISASSMLASLITATFQFNKLTSGGALGYFASEFMRDMFSIPGAYIFALAIWVSSLIILSPVSFISAIIDKLKQKLHSLRKDKKMSDSKVFPDRELPQGPSESEEPLIHDALAAALAIEAGKNVSKEDAMSGDLKTDNIRTFSLPGNYLLPDMEFLKADNLMSVRPSREELLSSSSMLEKKLKDFNVDGKVTQVHPGPVVTMYEFEPAPGVKINRVVSLSDDLALSLKAQSVRASTLPGKAAIGIEVPNKNRETVCLRDIISSDNYKNSPSKLTLALGKDIFGAPVVADLARMPHLLVAGATGSGKSVSINSMVVSLLYKSTPREVKMLMIDPKLLELSTYENIPHLIAPVITGAKEAAEALRKMVFEMERRYRLLAAKGVRNIDGFNKIASAEEHLPYIVIFIDELADLMFASAKEVEDSIARLAQMARAAGIHLILATQRPSVDVITGVIKANFPARIAFQVTTRIDSRTIIDGQGAEQLLGKGDMLLMLPGIRITRIHGALITGEEIKTITDFITSQGAPDYSIFESIRVEDPENDSQSGQFAEKDEMYDKVLEFAESVGEVSISSIQRRFKIGYNRAARVMEIMEEEGLVGPPRGAGKPRDYLGKR